MVCHRPHSRVFRPRAQHGQAALILVIMFGVGSLLYIASLGNSVSAAAARLSETERTMQDVKQALIGWSVARGSGTGTARPGELPCPDTDGPQDFPTVYGHEQGTCAAGRIGRVPWKTLGIPEPKDEYGETLWYAVSGPFRRTASTVINSDTKGTLTVYQGSSALSLTTEAIAVIFAPGPAVGSQSRNTDISLCSTTSSNLPRNRCAANYLEATGGGNNAANGGPFISAQQSDTFNDRLIVITTTDLIPQVEQRVARDILSVLQRYKANSGCNCYPWPDVSTGQSDPGLNRGRLPGFDPYSLAPYAAPVEWGSGGAPTLPEWFINNGWRRIIYYSVARTSTESGGGLCSSCTANTLTLDSSNGVEVILIMPGAAGAGRPVSYPWTDWRPYIDDNENNNFDIQNDIFITPTSSAASRDRIFTIP
jgi:hypothetical protein